MAIIPLCDSFERFGCTKRATCRRALEEPETDGQEYVKPDYWNGDCNVYREVETAAAKREAAYEEAVERFREAQLR